MHIGKISAGKKALIAGGVVLVGYLVWRHYSGTASAATLPTPAPSPLPSGGGAVHLTPVASPYATVSTGATNYLVTTATDPLNVRQGPGTSYPVVGNFDHGSAVVASGVLTTDPSGMTWAQVLDSSGNVIGWASTTYLSAASSGANVSYTPADSSGTPGTSATSDQGQGQGAPSAVQTAQNVDAYTWASIDNPLSFLYLRHP